ncbi:glycosyltransferase family 2 protein [Deltaproteobacteria bacterium PRO3]|nr:glycosyltransferase family 2 protein [Deltaproteobacteria bacterium PRO3]
MKFSLILATINRTTELEIFLKSLLSQNPQSFELIIVDQNNDNRLQTIIENFQDIFKIIHIKSPPGLSRARNAGLNASTGDLIAFPDDDCQYPPGLLDNIFELFLNNNCDGISGRCVDEYERDSAGVFLTKRSLINKFNVWSSAISVSLFIKRSAIQNLFFDENLGLGSNTPYQSGEETDFVLSLLNNRRQIIYFPNIFVIHPSPTTTFTEHAIQRAFKYGMGCGKVLKKHNYPVWYKVYLLFRPLGGALLSLGCFKISKAKYHFNIFKGRLLGMK